MEVLREIWGERGRKRDRNGHDEAEIPDNAGSVYRASLHIARTRLRQGGSRHEYRSPCWLGEREMHHSESKASVIPDSRWGSRDRQSFNFDTEVCQFLPQVWFQLN